MRWVAHIGGVRGVTRGRGAGRVRLDSPSIGPYAPRRELRAARGERARVGSRVVVARRVKRSARRCSPGPRPRWPRRPTRRCPPLFVHVGSIDGPRGRRRGLVLFGRSAHRTYPTNTQQGSSVESVVAGPCFFQVFRVRELAGRSSPSSELLSSIFSRRPRSCNPEITLV